MRRLSEPTDKVHLTLMSRAQGVGLDTIWHTLTPDQKSDYKNQLGHAMKQWRQFKSPVAKNVDGGIPEDALIGNCLRRAAPTCKKMGRTTEEWFDNLEKDLRVGLAQIHKTSDPLVIEEKFQELKKNFPKSEPYVLTHGDLNLTNIIVKDGKIEAILDWEYSAYLPWGAERWLSLLSENAYELFRLFWADEDLVMDEDIGLGMDADTFLKVVFNTVGPVCRAWNSCSDGKRVEHPTHRAKWLRPGFCKCNPFSGYFKWDEIGNQNEHVLKDE